MTPELQFKTIHVNGTDLAYVEQGTGDAVVFVHGGNTDFRSWASQVGPFSQRYRVISYSRRYHYPNGGVEHASEYLATDNRDDLAALIEGLGLAPAHIVASSYGAYIAMLLALTQPELVRSLALGEPGALFLLGSDFLTSHMERTIGPSRQAFELGDPEQAVRIFIDTVAGSGAFDHFPPPARAMLMDNAPEFKLEVNTSPASYFSNFTCEDAGTIKAPTLLVTGEISPRFLHEITDVLERCMPNTERAMIPHASHGMHNMNPQAYNEAVLAFLAKH